MDNGSFDCEFIKIIANKYNDEMAIVSQYLDSKKLIYKGNQYDNKIREFINGFIFAMNSFNIHNNYNFEPEIVDENSDWFNICEFCFDED